MSQRNRISSLPEHAGQLPRRQLLTQLAGGLAAVAAVSSTGKASVPAGWEEKAKALSSANLRGEAFWQLVKTHFPLRPGLILVNAANLCPSPYAVQEMIFELTRDIDSDASFQNRDKFFELKEDSRRALAGYLGALPEEIAITRNTTEGNNAVINGLDLREGDEVVLWDQNHSTNNIAWDVRADRYGFHVKRVTTPTPPQSAEELIQPFGDALTAKTKVLALTHISNLSGVGLPVKELCRMASERDILTLIDGAQTFGAFQVDLHDIGCDFYTGSAHKWFLGPKEVGVLYVRKDRTADLWPTTVGDYWEDIRDRGARKFEALGQRDDATLAAVKKTAEFHHSLGKERIEDRIRELAGLLKQELQKIPGTKLYTPLEPELSGGVVMISLPGIDPIEGFQYLYRRHQIGGAGIEGRFPGIRFCPHIYNPLDEIDRIVAAVAELAKTGVRG